MIGIALAHGLKLVLPSLSFALYVVLLSIAEAAEMQVLIAWMVTPSSRRIHAALTAPPLQQNVKGHFSAISAATVPTAAIAVATAHW